MTCNPVEVVWRLGLTKVVTTLSVPGVASPHVSYHIAIYSKKVAVVVWL